MRQRYTNARVPLEPASITTASSSYERISFHSHFQGRAQWDEGETVRLNSGTCIAGSRSEGLRFRSSPPVGVFHKIFFDRTPRCTAKQNSPLEGVLLSSPNTSVKNGRRPVGVFWITSCALYNKVCSPLQLPLTSAPASAPSVLLAQPAASTGTPTIRSDHRPVYDSDRFTDPAVDVHEHFILCTFDREQVCPTFGLAGDDNKSRKKNYLEHD